MEVPRGSGIAAKRGYVQWNLVVIFPCHSMDDCLSQADQA